MKRHIILFILVISISFTTVQAQMSTLTGAWEFSNGTDQHQLFFEDGYFIHTIHQADKFIMSRGGSYEASNGTIKAKVYFNSSDSSNVGGELNVPFEVSGDKLSMDVPDGRVNFNRVDDGKAPLAGVWRITGRMQEDGKVADIHQTGSRQTYKLLTGKKFQWVAIDPEKKEFSGTGGGSYTFKDGKYTEQIEFFSRDNSRVGVSLVFDGKLQDGKWHHSGLSSKGAKIYEVWSKVDE
nr:hypothetical protein [uncultured Pedobacter sp.]